MQHVDLDPVQTRARQRRLLDEMLRHELDRVVVCRLEHVQWLTGVRCAATTEPVAALDADGRCTLVLPGPAPSHAAVDDAIEYEFHRLCTLRNDQRAASSAVLCDVLNNRPRPKRIGVEFSSFGPHLQTTMKGVLSDIEPALYRLRRRKHPDELAMMRRAIAATAAMYARAREVIAPGVSELVVFNELQAAAVCELGEPLTATGNDYQSGTSGGPARPRAAEDGELYILDLGPAYRGYFADNCRTIAVNRRPTDAQHEAWRRLAGVFDGVPAMAGPGKSCAALYDRVKYELDETMPGAFFHHLGHGVGLYPHEAPHLNPNWDDCFETGDVFTVEPGMYGDSLRGGIRLEQNYLVTETGVELLTHFTLDLA